MLTGKEVASKIKEEIKVKLSRIERTLVLAIVCADDEASNVYFNTRFKVASALGIKVIKFDNSNLINTIKKLNNDNSIDGYIIDRPYPLGINDNQISAILDPGKDVEGLSYQKIATRWLGASSFAPATAQAVIKLLKFYQISLEQKLVVVIGRSVSVGRPLANLLTNENATVVLAHSKSVNLRELTLAADIVVVAVGKANLFGMEYFKKDAVVIDCGIHQVNNQIVGDVKSEVKECCLATPVPGGIGPITTALIFYNLCLLEEEKHGAIF